MLCHWFSIVSSSLCKSCNTWNLLESFKPKSFLVLTLLTLIKYYSFLWYFQQSRLPYYIRSRCADDQYQTTNSNGDTECHQCSPCPSGHGVLRLCTEYNDTICLPCPRGSYSVYDNTWSTCLKCRQCGPHQLMKTECTPANNRECSRACTPGIIAYHTCLCTLVFISNLKSGIQPPSMASISMYKHVFNVRILIKMLAYSDFAVAC